MPESIPVPPPSLNAEQTSPKPGAGVPTWDLVLADIGDRDAMGAAKYGVRHVHDNGLDQLIDVYQEQLDHVCYLRAEIESRKNRDQELERLAFEAKFQRERGDQLTTDHAVAIANWQSRAEKAENAEAARARQDDELGRLRDQLHSLLRKQTVQPASERAIRELGEAVIDLKRKLATATTPVILSQTSTLEVQPVLDRIRVSVREALAIVGPAHNAFELLVGVANDVTSLFAAMAPPAR